MIKKAFIAQVTIILVVALLTPSMANAQITSHYGAKIGDSGANLVGFDLTISSPISKEVYSNTLPLEFKLHWSPVGVSLFFNWTFSGIYTYSIDYNSPVSIESNQSSSDFYGYGAHSENGFKYNPSFSYLLDISNLENGQHSIVISAGMYFNDSGKLHELYKDSSSPIIFSVQNQMSNNTLEFTLIPDLPTALAITVLVVITVALAVVVKRRKKV
jgi:hypothetical protein